MVPETPLPPHVTSRLLCFGDFRLDSNLKLLFRANEKIKITALPFNALEYLARNQDRVISKAELLEKVWGGHRDASAVEQVIRQLRTALGDTVKEPRYIQTVAGYGYRLLAPVSADAPPSATPGEPTRPADALNRRLRFGRVPLGVGAVLAVCFAAVFIVRLERTAVIARAYVNGRFLSAVGASGRVLWTARLDYDWDHDLRDTDNSWRINLADLDGDGRPEVLVAAPVSRDEDELVCYSAGGKRLWRYRPAIRARFGAWEVGRPWRLMQVLVVRGPGRAVVYLTVIHPVWWQSFLVRLSTSGALEKVVLASSGIIYAVKPFQSRRGSYLLAAGINNEYRQVFLAALRPEDPAATSPQTEGSQYRCVSGCPPGRPYRYILLPRSELNIAFGLPYPSYNDLRTAGDSIEVETHEVASLAIRAIYDFSPDLGFTRFAFSDGYPEAHGLLQREGRIDHSFSLCPERGTPVTVRICDEQGRWTTASLPRPL